MPPKKNLKLRRRASFTGTKFGGGGKIGIGKRGRAKIPGGHSLSNPLPFCPPERSVFCSAFGGAINRSFVQKRFELRSVIATNSKTPLLEGFLMVPLLLEILSEKIPGGTLSLSPQAKNHVRIP